MRHNNTNKKQYKSSIGNKGGGGLSILKKRKYLNKNEIKQVISRLYWYWHLEKSKPIDLRNENKAKAWIRELTRLLYDSKEYQFSPNTCVYCGTHTKEIHHKVYRFPPKLIDILRCCHKCNMKQGKEAIIWD